MVVDVIKKEKGGWIRLIRLIRLLGGYHNEPG